MSSQSLNLIKNIRDSIVLLLEWVSTVTECSPQHSYQNLSSLIQLLNRSFFTCIVFGHNFFGGEGGSDEAQRNAFVFVNKQNFCCSLTIMIFSHSPLFLNLLFMSYLKSFTIVYRVSKTFVQEWSIAEFLKHLFKNDHSHSF